MTSEERKEYIRKYRIEHRKQMYGYTKAWKDRNKDRLREYNRQYMKEYYRKNRDRILEANKIRRMKGDSE